MWKEKDVILILGKACSLPGACSWRSAAVNGLCTRPDTRVPWTQAVEARSAKWMAGQTEIIISGKQPIKRFHRTQNVECDGIHWLHGSEGCQKRRVSTLSARVV